MKQILILTILVLFFIQTPAHAQTNFGTNTVPEESILLSPAFPQPNETVTATLNVFGAGISGAEIQWVLDGKVIESASNRREAKFVAGNAGTVMNLQAVLRTPLGTVLTIPVTIRPVYLDIVIEPQTRVPDFYQGRALPSIGSTVNATALIDDGKLNNSDFVYTWRLEQKVLEFGPIRSNNQVSFEMPRGKDASLFLQVSRPDGTAVASRAILVPSVSPKIVFYENNSLYGISHSAITKQLIMTGSTATVRAEPYYVDLRTFNNPDLSEWTIDSEAPFTPTGNPYQVTVQKNGVSGQTKLGFHIRDLSQVLQGARNTVTITY